MIGAGVGGVAAAARLAAAGHRVSVYEQAATVGGKLGRYERDGFRFDTGPRLLTLPQVFTELFEATGSRLTDELDLVPLDPVVRHVFADGTALDSCGDPDEFAARIGAVFGDAAAAGWRVLWRRAARVWHAAWRDILTSTVDSPWTLARLAWHAGDLAAIAPGRSLHWLARRYLPDPRLRMLLGRYATYAGADPRRAPAALVAIPYAELTFGGWYVCGGLRRIADALLRRCDAQGVQVRTGTPVDGVEVAGGSVTGLRLAGGGTVPADVVVCNADALTLYRDLLPDPRRAARLAERSLAGFVLLLGRRGPVGHTVYFPSDYTAEFDDVFVRPRPPADPAIYVSVDEYGTQVLVNAPPQGPVDWRAPGLADRYADQVLATLAARGLDVRDALRVVRTPADLEAETASPGGAIYGTPAHRLLRPANRGPVRGLYLVGGSTHPGGGLPMVALSAKIVADAIGPA